MRQVVRKINKNIEISFKFLWGNTMLKKISFILAMMTASLSAMDTDQFNPEKAPFSQMATLRTWVSRQYQSDDIKMKEIQRNVGMETPENPFSLNFVKSVYNNRGDERYFGKNFYALESMQLPFLQFVHDISQNKEPIVLEIAAAWGLVTWKIPYAFEKGGIVYTNELSSFMLENYFSVIQSSIKRFWV